MLGNTYGGRNGNDVDGGQVEDEDDDFTPMGQGVSAFTRSTKDIVRFWQLKTQPP